MRRFRAGHVTALIALALVVLAVGVAPTMAGGNQLDLRLCAPDQNRFTLDINNDFFPLPVGQRWVLSGEDEGQTIGLRITVFNATEPFYGGQVTTRVVEELEWEDDDANGRVNGKENLREVSRNYYAQTQAGTVCYFGEDVDIYEDGQVVSHEGAWRADASGNAPGIYMPKEPRPGMSFKQEVAPGVAEDEATIVGSGTIEVPAGTFREAIRVRETNPLDGSVGYKAYAEDVGLIQDDPLELISYKR